VGGLHGRTRLTDDLDVAVVLEQLTEAGSDHLVVVQQKYPNHAHLLTGANLSLHRAVGSV
jgi:hypothetical protein